MNKGRSGWTERRVASVGGGVWRFTGGPRPVSIGGGCSQVDHIIDIAGYIEE